MKKLFVTLLFAGFISFIPSSLHLPITSALSAQIPSDGLVAWYPFNGNANDESGNGINGSVIGPTLTSDRNGNLNSAYNFGGGTNRINYAANSALMGVADVSISFWMKAQSQPDWESIYLRQGDITTGYTKTWILLSGDASLIRVYNNSNCYIAHQKTSGSWLNNWHHFVVLFIGTEIHLYIDGVDTQVGQNNNQFSYCVGMQWSNNPQIMGYSGGTGNQPYPYKGSLDDFAFYNRILNNSEIQQLYQDQTGQVQQALTCNITSSSTTLCEGESVTLSVNTTGGAATSSQLPANLQQGLVAYYPFNGNANDESGNGNNGTLQGAQLTTGINGLPGSAYVFDGVDDVVTIPATPSMLPSNLSLSLWFKLPELPSGNHDWQRVFRSRFYGYILSYLRSSNLMVFEVYPAANLDHNSISVTLPTNDFEWHQITCTYNGIYTRIYLDGNFVSESNLPFPGDIYYASDGLVTIARDGNSTVGGTSHFQGSLDEVYLYNRALSEVEVSQLYASQSYAWSTNATTPAITVTPTQNTTYTCTITQGNQTCTTSVDITVNPNITNAISATINDGETYTLGTQTLTTSGTYTEVFTSATGCDSTVTLTLSLDLPTSSSSCGAVNVHSASMNYGSVSDIDGNVYKTIQIGNQEWMAENLKSSHYSNGDLIPIVTNNALWSALTTGSTSWFSNDSVSYNCPYGKLYNWYAVADSRNICPSGWRVPSDGDLSTLQNYLGGWGVAGGKMKSQGITYWTAGNSGETNESGFSALPGGARVPDGGSGYMGILAHFWTSTIDAGQTSSVLFRIQDNSLDRFVWDNRHGFSVRCLKDELTQGSINFIECAQSTLSGVISQGVASIGITANVPYAGGNSGEYNGLMLNSYGVTGLTATLLPGNFSSGNGHLTFNISGIAANSGVANFSINIGGQSCTLSINIDANSNFSSTASCGSPTVHNPYLSYGTASDQDGNSYKTIIIGDQEWMAENLKSSHYSNGDIIPIVTNNALWSVLTTGATSWFNNDSISYNCPYGKLYNWYAVADSRNICPSGWRVPSDGDLTTLQNYLGGWGAAGGKMKSQGITYWTSGNSGGTNESGFSALPGGARVPDGGSGYIGMLAHFWTTTPNSDQSNAVLFRMQDATLDRFVWGTKHGFSVRCLRQSQNFQGSIQSIDCGSNIGIGSLTQGVDANDLVVNINYNGGNGGVYTSQTFNSVGVTGLVAQLNNGAFESGSGVLSFIISGVPSTCGNANFQISIGGQSCNLSLSVEGLNLTNNINASIFEGQSYTLGTQTLTTAGTYTEVFSSAAGCDSTVTLTLAVEPLLTCEITAPTNTLCEGESITLSVNTTGGAGASSQLPANLQQGLVAYYPFNGNANDESGNGNNGLVNGATLATDRFGNAASAYALDGVGNFIQAPRSNLGEFTISMWVNVTNYNCYGTFIDAYNSNWEFLMDCPVGGVELSGNVEFVSWNPGGNGYIEMPVGYNIPKDEWVNLILSYSSNIIKVYQNGNLISQLNNISFNQTGGNYNFGASISGTPQYLNGILDDIFVFNRPLSSSEIQQLYTAQSYAWSTNETTPTITVSPTQSTTYSCTVTQGNQTCTDSITITVNPLLTWYADADADGFGNPDDVVQDCNQTQGYVADNTDCNDEDANSFPGGIEICDNNLDENCDGLDSLCFVANLGCTDVNACNFNPQANTNDGSCILPQPETCNGLDDNCNGQVDEGFSIPTINAVAATPALYPTCTGNALKSANLLTGTDSPVIAGSGPDLWYSFTAQYNTLRVGLSAAFGDNSIGLYTNNNGCLELISEEHEVYTATTAATGNQILLTDQLTVGQTYYVAVHQITGPANASAKVCFTYLNESSCDHYYSNNTGVYTNVCNSFKAQYRANATNYLFNVLSGTQNGVNMNLTTWTYTNNNSNSVVARLGSIIPANHSGVNRVYTLSVPTVYGLTDAAGNVSNLVANATSTCAVTLNSEATIALRQADRCPTNKSLTSTIAPDRTVCGAMRYDWEFTQVLPTVGTAQVVQGGNYTTVFFLSNVPGITAGKTYNVRVRPVHSSGIAGQWGSVQCLRVGSFGMVQENHPGSADADPPLLSLRAGGEMNSSFAIYPNPTSTGSFVLEYNDARRGELIFAQESMTELVMMDITGKIVFKTNVVLNGNLAEIHFGDLESGLYLVDFGGERSRVQVMK
jgi:uncharacterized protein (TIGR02145 family)